jgi:hypothetical protein
LACTCCCGDCRQARMGSGSDWNITATSPQAWLLLRCSTASSAARERSTTCQREDSCSAKAQKQATAQTKSMSATVSLQQGLQGNCRICC